MRRWTISLAAAIFGLAMLIGVPQASAGTPGCVTRGEFRQVSRGMPIARVHNIFGTTGVFLDRQTSPRGLDVFRGYPLCFTTRRAAVLNFDNYSSRRPGLRMFAKAMPPL
jgi:hypothetical protein